MGIEEPRSTVDYNRYISPAFFETTKKFPGLGVLKKWTLVHHLELLSLLLDQPTNWLRMYSKIEELHSLICGIGHTDRQKLV